MKAPWAASRSQQSMAPGPSQPLALVNKDFSKQCCIPSSVYCLGLLLYYKGRLEESLQKKSPGCKPQASTVLPSQKVFQLLLLEVMGEAATLCADREHTKPSLKAVESSAEGSQVRSQACLNQETAELSS